MESQKIPILVVGATGQLGELATRELLKYDNLLVNIMVRDVSKKHHIMQEVQAKGGRIMQADLEKPETLKDSTKGIHTVLSFVVGDDKIVIDGQLALLHDAIQNNVKRFVPSDYSMDYKQVPELQHPLSQQRKNMRKHLDSKAIKGLHIHIGVFIETYIYAMNYFLEHLDVLGLTGKEKGLPYFENADQKLDFSTYPDVAKYVAAAVADPNRIGDLYISTAGELSTNEIAKIYSKVVEREVLPLKLGTVQDLIKIINERRPMYEKKKQSGEIGTIRHVGEMNDPDFIWGVFVGYMRLLYTGVGKLPQNEINEYPQVQHESFEEFLRNHPDQRLELFGIYGKISEKAGHMLHEVAHTKDAVFNKVEEAVGYLVKNAKSVTEDLRNKLKHLLKDEPETTGMTGTTGTTGTTASTHH